MVETRTVQKPFCRYQEYIDAFEQRRARNPECLVEAKPYSFRCLGILRLCDSLSICLMLLSGIRHPASGIWHQVSNLRGLNELTTNPGGLLEVA